MEEKHGGQEPEAGRHPLRQVLVAYEHFEQIVAVVLSIIIAVIVLVAMVELVRIVIHMLEAETLNLLQQESFQLVFGMIMTLLIALEFKHSIIKVALHDETVVQVKTVILIALLALARKFVILDPATGPGTIAALAMALLALGVVYWLMRGRDGREAMRRYETGEGENRKAKPRPPGQAQG